MLQHKQECEAAGLYDEAELARRRILHVRKTQEKRVAKELKSGQLLERMGLEEAHVAELRQLTAFWDEKQAEFERHGRSLQEQLAARQASEHEATVLDLRANLEPRMPRWSKDLLSMRRSAEHLHKQKKFSQAASTKKQGDELERKEFNLFLEARETKLAAREERFLAAQQREAAGLAKRIQVGRDELRLSRRAELARLLQRHQNATQTLVSQQKILRHRVAQSPKDWMHKAPLQRPASAVELGADPDRAGSKRGSNESAKSRPSTAAGGAAARSQSAGNPPR